MKRIPQEELAKLSEESRQLIEELYKQAEPKPDDEATKANAELERLLKAKRKEFQKSGEIPKQDADALKISEWKCVTHEWWRLPVCLLTMPEFSSLDAVLLAYLIDVTNAGTREILLSRPHVSERTGISTKQITRTLQKLEARNLIETKQTGREVKVTLTGATYILSPRESRMQPNEGGEI